MPAYNFSYEFANCVKDGIKTQTIRQSDKGAKIGDAAHLFTGQRTSSCQKLGTGTITAVTPIVLFKDSCLIEDKLFMFSEIPNLIARADGFATYAHMAEWFRQKYSIADLDEKPFKGFIHA